MPSFAYPWVLLFLLIPAVIIGWLWRRNGQHVVLPFDGGISKKGTGLRILLNLAQTLPILLLATVIIILAGPQQVSEPKLKRSLTNIQFCLDVSGSMMAQFGDGNRYDGAMESLNSFIGKREGDAFGLTVFGGDQLHWIRLTSDPNAFKYAAPFLAPQNLPRWFNGGTYIGKALESVEKLLIEAESGDRMIILFSDGASFDLSNGEDERIARSLANNGITLYGIHIAEGEAPPEVGLIANITGGEIFTAGDPLALDTIFKRIDEMQETKMEKSNLESMDWFAPFAITGLSIGGLHLLLLIVGIRYNPW
jgi:Ca-activated chloride channel family protein